MSNHRRSERRLTLRTGKIFPPDREFSFDCAVLNISTHGACVLVPDGASVPENFTLRIDRDDAAHSCTLAWREGARIGVSFA